MKAAFVRNLNDLRIDRQLNNTTSSVRRSLNAKCSKASTESVNNNMTKANASGSEVEPEDRESIEKMLRCSEKDESIVLSSIECSPGSRLGDNYMSIVKRVRVKGRRNGNEEFNRSLIIKRPIQRLSRRRLFRCDEAFANEISAYRRLVPVLNRFVAHTGQSLPIPKCLFAGNDNSGDLVVLEDLRESGYRMVDRLKGLDVEHCRLVMKKLGALHGVSIAMKSIEPKKLNECKRHVEEIVYCSEAAVFYSTCLDSSVSEALSSLRASNGDGKLNESIKKIEQLNGKMYDIMSEMINQTNDDWKIMCHGDLWINNLLFKYSESNPLQVKDVIFIDLQTTRYASVAIDILHFIYTSTEGDLRANHLDALLTCYLDALLDEVRLHVFDQETLTKLSNQFTLDGIWQEIRSKIMYGLGISMWLLPAVTFHHDRIPNLNAITMSDFTNSKQVETITQLQTPEYHKRIREVVLELTRNGFIS